MTDDQCVLLVEDNIDEVNLIQRAMRKAGMNVPVRIVSDGDAAVDYLNGDGRFFDRGQFPVPTLVLLDLKLPRRNGFEVLTELRRHAALGKTIVVVLTSSQESEDVRRAYAAGANSYLVKPIKPAAMQELMNRVRQYWLESNEPPPIFAPSS